MSKRKDRNTKGKIITATWKLFYELGYVSSEYGMKKVHCVRKMHDNILLPSDFDRRSPDNMILTVALKYKGSNPILLTSDNGLQIKARGLGITTISLKEILKK